MMKIRMKKHGLKGGGEVPVKFDGIWMHPIYCDTCRKRIGYSSNPYNKIVYCDDCFQGEDE